MFQIRARYEGLKTLAFGDVGHGAYVQIQDMAGDDVVASHSFRSYTIKNATDQDVFITWDPNQDPFLFLPSGESYTEDISSNQALMAGLEFSKGSTLWIQDAGVAPAAGAIY